MNTYRNWTTTQNSRTPKPKSALAGPGVLLIGLLISVLLLVLLGVVAVHAMHTFSSLLNHMSSK